MKRSPLIFMSLLTLALMSISLPFVVWGNVQAMRNVENSPPMWVPESFEQRREFNWLVDTFGYQEVIVVSWDGCHIDDSRLKRFEDAIKSPEDSPRAESIQRFYRDAQSGYTAVRSLTAPPLNMSREEAIKRLRGSLVGPNGRTSCLVVVLNFPEPNQRPAIQETLLDVAEETVGLARNEFYLGGSIIDGVAIDRENNRATFFALPSAVVSLLLCRLCLKSWRLTLAVILVAAMGEALMMAMVYYTGTTMNAVLAVMAPLVFVLTVSSGVHLVNYFYDQSRQHGLQGAALRALKIGWGPCVVAAVTTAIGLGSLTVSDIVPIKQFGGFAAVGIMTTLGLLFLLVPGAMTWFAASDKSSADTSINMVPTSDLPDDLSQPRLEFNLARFVCRFSGRISLVCLGLMVLTGWGLSRVRTSVSVRNLLVPQSRTIQDYRWLESHVGPLIPIDVVLRFDASCPLDALERLELVRQVQDEMSGIELLGGTMSAATFFPNVPQATWRQMGRRVALRRILERWQESLVDAQWLHKTQDEQAWRISTRIRALDDLDYGRFLEQLRERIGPVATGPMHPGVQVTYTGLMPLIYAAQTALLKDLFVSFLTALVLVTVVMMFVLRSIATGLVAMIPNVFPAAVLFGSMGWFGIAVDIGTMMTASVALGIAVDGTIHFLTWYRRELNDGHTNVEAVCLSFRHCAPALTHTTIICGIGLLIFSLSQFLPTQRFAWMMFTLLAAALVGDLLLLPALLAGPIGRLFVRAIPKEALTVSLR